MFWSEFKLRYADDGFGNLVKIDFAMQCQVINYSYPVFEDYI